MLGRRFETLLATLGMALAVAGTALAGASDREAPIYPFPTLNSGSEANGSLVVRPNGDLYGSTLGTNFAKDGGLIFRLRPSGSHYVETVLYRFPADGKLGTEPSPIVMDASNGIFGVTSKGIFELTYSTVGAWRGRLLHECNGGLAAPTIHHGDIYAACGYEIVKLTRSRFGYDAATLYRFAGDAPNGNLVVDDRETIYGTTRGGVRSAGTVFELAMRGSSWVRTVLHRFDFSDNNIAYPTGGLTMDASGALYGLTAWGVRPVAGSTNQGTFYKLEPGAARYRMSVHYVEAGYGASGTPAAGNAGTYYAAISGQGSSIASLGYIVKFSPTVSGYRESVVHAFAGGSDGYAPIGSLAADASGTLYGSTWYGGDARCSHPTGCGTVFEVAP